MLLIMVWQPLVQILSVSLLLRCTLQSYLASVNCLNLSMYHSIDRSGHIVWEGNRECILIS